MTAITIELDHGIIVQRQPPAQTKCARCIHFGDFVTGADWCDRHEQTTLKTKDGRMIVTSCTGFVEAVEVAS